MFLGTHEPRLDEKGRLILPAKYRDELSAGLVLTRGQERCVYVFPMREFERLHEQLRDTPVTARTSRNNSIARSSKEAPESTRPASKSIQRGFLVARSVLEAIFSVGAVMASAPV